MYKCKNGCGYEHQHRGAMNIHENIHCSKLKAEKKNTNTNINTSKCEHEWSLLGNNTVEEVQAKRAGYTKYCTLCYEVE